MKMIKTEHHEKVLVIKMDRGVTNAINLALIRELTKILDKAKKDSAVHSLVLTSANEKFFSIGFDIPRLYELDKRGFKTFFQAFNKLCLDLYTFPKPIIAALAGHAIAGGCILALCCDYRMISEGKKLMGLNEIKLGVPVPYAADCILRELVGFHYAREILDMGEFYRPEELFEMGMVDELLPLKEVLAKSIEKARTLGSLPQEPFITIKGNRTERVVAQITKHLKKKEEIFLKQWFSEEARQRLKEAMEKF